MDAAKQGSSASARAMKLLRPMTATEAEFHVVKFGLKTTGPSRNEAICGCPKCGWSGKRYEGIDIPMQEEVIFEGFPKRLCPRGCKVPIQFADITKEQFLLLA